MPLERCTIGLLAQALRSEVMTEVEELRDLLTSDRLDSTTQEQR